MHMRPKIAIVDANTLAAIGLKGILQNVMPMMIVDIYGSFSELEANSPDVYYHYFVSMNIAIGHLPFFSERRMKTIVLTLAWDGSDTANTPSAGLRGFHCLGVNVPEHELVRSILALEQHAHARGRNLPFMTEEKQEKILSDREVEVMSLIVKGFINKEIAEKLNIGLSTVITHRKNIMDKLQMKSVSALTIYAVMHGYVDINSI